MYWVFLRLQGTLCVPGTAAGNCGTSKFQAIKQIVLTKSGAAIKVQDKTGYNINIGVAKHI